MARLKLWFGKVYSHDERLVNPKSDWVRQFDAAVVSTSQAKVAAMVGETVGRVATYWSCMPTDTTNPLGLHAVKHPHRVWAIPHDKTLADVVDVTRTK